MGRGGGFQIVFRVVGFRWPWVSDLKFVNIFRYRYVYIFLMGLWWVVQGWPAALECGLQWATVVVNSGGCLTKFLILFVDIFYIISTSCL